MSDEILLNVTPQEARIALIENNHLQEIYVERNNRQGIFGNIYKGRVSRLVPGMQAAFVDIGLERSAFLHLTDMLEYIVKKNNQENVDDLDIHDFLKSGQEILVQVYKDPLGTKGARLTTQFGIPSRYLVITPYLRQISISQKISDPVTRERLQGCLKPSEIAGYIVRTVAQDASSDDILADQKFLDALWENITLRAKESKPAQIVYNELPIEFRVLRDFASKKIERIRVDDEKTTQTMREFAAQYIPRLEKYIEYYKEKTPIFDLYLVDDEIQKLLERKVYLKSGGYIVIDQTEAMTTIDVNTGSYLGQSHADDIIFQTNLEAIGAIARQIRIRNLGGIIIVDFIDMDNPQNREILLKTLIDTVSKDTARVEVSEVTSLGLVQMTRKRTRESLEHILCDPCPYCQKRGSIKSVQTVSYEIFRDLKRLAIIYTCPGLVVHAAGEVIEYLKREEMKTLEKLELELEKPIKLKSEPTYGREQFSVLPLG